MFMGKAGPASLTFNDASAQAGHLDIGASLVDEDEAFRIEVELAVEPSLPLGVDGRKQPFGCMRCFLGGSAFVEEAPCHGTNQQSVLNRINSPTQKI